MSIRKKDILILSVLTFLTVLAWVIFEVHHAASRDTIKPPIKKLLTPLEGEIDTQLIEELKTGEQ